MNYISNYNILSSDKNSRYAILESKLTGEVVIADIIEFKVLYVFDSEKYHIRYVRPKSIIFNVPDVVYLNNQDETADIIIFKGYQKNSLIGTAVLVFEKGKMCVFNSMSNSTLTIKNITKAILSSSYSCELEESELFIGHELKLRFVLNGSYQELGIDILTRSDLVKYGGIAFNSFKSYKFEKLFKEVDVYSARADKTAREVSILNLKEILSTPVLKSNVSFGIMNNCMVRKDYYYLK